MKQIMIIRLVTLTFALTLSEAATLLKNETKEETYFPRLPDLPTPQDASDDQVE